MAERLSPREERRSRQDHADARSRGIPVADNSTSAEPAADSATRRVATEPVARRTAARTEATPATEAPGSVTTHFDAADSQTSEIEATVARVANLHRGQLFSGWKKWRFWLGNALLGSSVFGSVAGIAAFAGLAALPATIFGLAVGVPAVWTLRSLLGVKELDRMAKGGEVVDRIVKKRRKEIERGRRKGYNVTFARGAELDEQVRSMMKRPSWKPLAVSLSAGLLTGEMVNVFRLGESVVFNTIGQGVSNVWDGLYNGNWFDKTGGLWNAVCEGTTSPNKPETIIPTSSHSYLGTEGLAKLPPHTSSYPPGLMNLPPPDAVAAPAVVHLDAANTHSYVHSHLAGGENASVSSNSSAYPPGLMNHAPPHTLPPVSHDAPGLGGGEVTKPEVPSVSPLELKSPPELVPGMEDSSPPPPPPLETGHPEFYGFESSASAPTGWDGFEKLTELVGEKPDEVTTDLFDDYMENDASRKVLEDFFGKEIPVGASFQEIARTLPNGSELDYGVLNEPYKGVTPLARMIERAENLGYTDAVEKLQAIQSAFDSNPDADLKLHIRN